ncbi:hypothetical protein [Chitinophaga sp.]|uniref:hypothetical protein n=1 Tax=Chitinophaga sp. TaxID=1869181 RepID=UPI0031D18972
MWTSISYDELNDKIVEFEETQIGKLYNFWVTIKIEPAKWNEETYGLDGKGFWAVALIGKLVIWYNDIEEGFNISRYNHYGVISEYKSNQDELYITVSLLLNSIMS